MGEWPCTVEGVERVKEYGGFRMDILRAKTIDLFHYSDYTEKQRKNSALNLREIEDGRIELDSYPRRLVLELTNTCNLNCIMCGRDESGFSSNFFDINYQKWICN